ncbi:MAG: hypothetical protein U9O96_02785 [Candidatus Thermoplasmatota archaeon]|nr:hypothetical protein [Candidatus Thermoplasmatota archaeon]
MPIKFGKKAEETKDAKEIDKGELGGWIRRMEQNINSLDKRLDAIERRLSGEKFIQPKMGKSTRENYSESLENEIQNISKKVNDEIKTIREELLKFKILEKNRLERDNDSKNKDGKNPTVISIKSGVKKSDITGGQINTKEIADLERRMEKLEKRKATVKVGKIEVPIEITGIVGGILAFIIAALLFEGYKDLVASPIFVMSAGLILVSAVALKTYVINISRK